MLREQSMDMFAVLGVQFAELQLAGLDGLLVDAFGLQVQHVGHAAGHAGTEVAAGATDDERLAAGHVLAAVVADSLDHRGGTGVADQRSVRRPGRG